MIPRAATIVARARVALPKQGPPRIRRLPLNSPALHCFSSDSSSNKSPRFKFDFNKRFDAPNHAVSSSNFGQSTSSHPSSFPSNGTSPSPAEQPKSNLPAVFAPVPAIPTGLGGGILEDNATNALVLTQPALVVTRAIEWGNVLLGFEQANKYEIRNSNQEIVGYIAEEDSLGKSLLRNVHLAATHRSFKATVLDPSGNIVFVVRRPFYFVSSSMFIEDANGTVIGEVHMNYHLWRRRYDIYYGRKQFARVDSGFLGQSFSLEDEKGRVMAVIDRNFTGWARELFTDGRQYIVRLDPSAMSEGDVTPSTSTALSTEVLPLDQRAIVLATAIAVDFDYFSLQSRQPGLIPGLGGGMMGPMPIPIPMPGGSEPVPAAGGAVGGEAPLGSMPLPPDSQAEQEEQFEEPRLLDDDEVGGDEEGVGGWLSSFFDDD